MTREEAIKLIQNLIDQMNENGYAEIDSFHEDALLMAVKALEQEPCEDAISRQAVLDIAKSSKLNWIDNSVLYKRVNELPPVTPQPKKGHIKEQTV